MNKKPIILFLSLVCMTQMVKGQADFGVVFWSEERNLNWDDFKGKPLVDSTNSFYMDLYIEYFSDNSFWFGGNGYVPRVYVYTNTSFADEDIRSDDLLRYFNVYFDLAGYYALKLANTIAEARKSEDPNIRNNLSIIKNAVVEEWRVETARLTYETQYGVEIEKLIMWEHEVEDLINGQSKPVYTPSEYALTFALGMGPRYGMNEFDNFLKNQLCGYLDLEVVKAPFTFNLGVSGGRTTVLDTFAKGEERFEIDSEPSITNIFLQAGYQVISSPGFKLTPRAGIHFTNLFYPEDQDFDSSVWGISFCAGLTADINFFTWQHSNYYYNGYSRLGLRIAGLYYPTTIGEQNLSHAIVTAGIYYTFSTAR